MIVREKGRKLKHMNQEVCMYVCMIVREKGRKLKRVNQKICMHACMHKKIIATYFIYAYIHTNTCIYTDIYEGARK